SATVLMHMSMHRSNLAPLANLCYGRHHMSVINNYHCEITVAQHCNLSCRACTHLSPLLSKDFVDPETLRSDLTTMAKYYHTKYARLLGGGPLLHRNILPIIAVARVAGTYDRDEVVPAGLRVWKHSDE